MSGMIPFNSENPEFSRLSALPTDQLKQELARYLSLSLESLVHAAMAVRILEDRGEDLSQLRFSIMPYLQKIAHGQMIPEVVTRFMGRPDLIARVSALPMPDQRRLADGQPVKLVQRTPDGQTTHRLVDPLSLNREEMQQVFHRDHLRRDDEQAVIVDRRKADAAENVTLKVGNHPVDPDLGIYVGRILVTWAELDEAQKYRAKKRRA